MDYYTLLARYFVVSRWVCRQLQRNMMQHIKSCFLELSGTDDANCARPTFCASKIWVLESIDVCEDVGFGTDPAFCITEIAQDKVKCGSKGKQPGQKRYVSLRRWASSFSNHRSDFSLVLNRAR